MTGFTVGMALGCCAVALLPTGILHLRRPAAFGSLVAAHGVVPARTAPAVAVAVALAEVTVGGAAAAVLIAGGGPARFVLGAGMLLGGAFAAYLAALLRRPDTGLGCGCTPLSGPVTAASLLPGGTLAAVCALGLAGAGPAAPSWFGAAWGATLIAAVMLVPASGPAPEPGTA